MSFNPFHKVSIFGEYIRDKSNKFPVNIINPEIPEFHFILAFATDDYDPATKQGKGNFSTSWNVSDFSPEVIYDMKKNHPNVKVVISIGGHGTDYLFNPENKLQWIDNAKTSLNYIIENDYKYKDDCGCGDKTVIDGIDINYQYVESDEFVECIGEIIDYVKSNGLKVCISPSAAKDSVLLQYKNLYKHNKDNIDWVNYPFYDQKISTTKEFLKLYTSLSDFFSHEKLLVGVSTDPDYSDNLRLILDGCKILGDLVVGIYVWNANYSMVLEEPYYVEIKAQNLLLHPNN